MTLNMTLNLQLAPEQAVVLGETLRNIGIGSTDGFEASRITLDPANGEVRIEYEDVEAINGWKRPVRELVESVPERANQEPLMDGSSNTADPVERSNQLSIIENVKKSLISELKEPLTVIRGCAELLANPTTSAEKREKCSDMILEDIDRFIELSQELFDYSEGAPASA